MKALSVRQPHAEHIARGGKILEIRSRPTKFRGRLLICASKTYHGLLRGLPRGVAVCTVELVGCRPFLPPDEDDACVAWEPGMWAWELAGAKRVRAVRVIGRLSFFDVPDDVVAPLRGDWLAP